MGREIGNCVERRTFRFRLEQYLNRQPFQSNSEPTQRKTNGYRHFNRSKLRRNVKITIDLFYQSAQSVHAGPPCTHQMDNFASYLSIPCNVLYLRTPFIYQLNGYM
jgi:hypothetical protein